MIRNRSASYRCVLILVAAGLLPAASSAQSGSWEQNVFSATPYNWGDAANWTGGGVANGANNTATFATPGLVTGDMSINMDTARTIGTLTFDNPTNTSSWFIGGANVLTLSSAGGPTISVASAGASSPLLNAVISAPLAGTQGFTKTGHGTLYLTGDASGLSGGITIAANGGTLSATQYSTANNPLGSNAITLSAGATLQLGAAAPSPSVLATLTPSSFTQKMVVPAGTTFATSGITATMDGGAALTGYTFYQIGQGPAAGLPTGTTITSSANPTFRYQLQSTSVNNALLLDAAHASGTMTLTTPVTTNSLSLLTATANGGGPSTLMATLHYTDGTPNATGLTVQSPDWLTTGGLGSFGRISASGYATGGNLFGPVITNPNPADPIGSIDVSWAAGNNVNGHTAIFAIGGPFVPAGSTPPPPPTIGAQNFAANNVVVTGNCTISAVAAATLGNLSIGSNTLSLNGTSLTFGAVTLSGNPSFNIGSGLTVTPGAFSDGGTVRTITVFGSGTLTIGAASPGLSAGTGVTVTSGTVTLNSATGFGPSPNVTLTGGIVNLGTSINPTFASLGGTTPTGGSGTLNLNGNTLAMGTGTANYAGAIQDGSAPGALVKTGAGTQTLSGTINSFSGGATINAGTLAVTNVGALGTGPVTLNGGTLSVAGAPVAAPPLNNFGSAANWSLNGTATFTATNQLQLTPNSPGSGSAWYNGIRLSTGPFSLRFTYTVLATDGVPADGFTVGFQNAGLTALGSAGGGLGYAGIIPSAAVQFNIYPPNTAGGIGSGLVLVTNGATQTGVASSAPVNMGVVNHPTNVTMTYDGTYFNVSLAQGSNVFVSGPIPFNIASRVGPNAIFGFTGATGASTAQQQITNLQFGGPSFSTYVNNVIVAATPATIQVAATPAAPAAALGNATFAIPSATLTVTADPGTIANQPFSLSLGATTLNGPTTFNVVNNGTGAGTLALGVVSDGPGASSLIKTGSGTLVLGAANTFSGATTITSGTLRAANPTGSATGTGSITVAAGGVLAGGDGGGSASPFADSTQGFISGTVIVQPGGILAPGINGPGLLTIGGGITFQSGSTFAVALATHIARSGASPVDVNTNSRVVTPLDMLIGSSLTVAIDGGGQTFTAGNTYDFFIGQNGAGGGLPTTATFLPTDFASPANPGDFTLSQSANGRDLILTFSPVPEPGTLALIAAAGISLVRATRRRRRDSPHRRPAA